MDNLGDLTFSIEVDFTDRNRHPDRSFVTFTTVVHLLIATELEAHLVAAHWVAATRPQDFMVTATRTLAVIA
jgi:hypothetical protein